MRARQDNRDGISFLERPIPYRQLNPEVSCRPRDWKHSPTTHPRSGKKDGSSTSKNERESTPRALSGLLRHIHQTLDALVAAWTEMTTNTLLLTLLRSGWDLARSGMGF